MNDNVGLNIEEHVLITGASGFLGRHIARLLSRKGARVIGIGHGHWTRDEWTSWGLSQWNQVDVTLQTLERYADKPSTIIHCAGGGSVAFSVQHPLADFHRTVVTTANVLEYVRLHAPACRIVYPSSASVYGTVEMLPIREAARNAPISPYGAHKVMAEQLIASYATQFKTSASIVRLFSVYGCGLRKQLLWDACCKMSGNDHQFMGTGDEVRDWLHIEDAAALMAVAAEHATPHCPIVNGGSGEGVTVSEILGCLGNSLLGGKASPLFSGAQRTGDPSLFIADINAASRWGWQPERDWRDGVAEYARWWKTIAK